MGMEHALTAFRRRHNLTLAAFAERIGVGKSAVYKWETGACPRPAMMARIVAATNGAVTANDFIPSQSEAA
jgi:transcriptional regulator with XRE-family HTH domain